MCSQKVTGSFRSCSTVTWAVEGHPPKAHSRALGWVISVPAIRCGRNGQSRRGTWPAFPAPDRMLAFETAEKVSTCRRRKAPNPVILKVALPPHTVKQVCDGIQVLAVTLVSGKRIPISVLYLIARSAFSSDLAETLGCAVEEGPFGPVIVADGQQQTLVRGFYAAGDITRPAFNASRAAADGARAGVFCHQSLAGSETHMKVRTCLALPRGRGSYRALTKAHGPRIHLFREVWG